MLSQYNNSKTRKFQPKQVICHMSQTNKYSFRYYNLNIYKNFLRPFSFHIHHSGDDDEYNELNSLLAEILSAVFDIVDYAAIFVIKLDGTKLVYDISPDCHFDPEQQIFVADEPHISVTRISDDFNNDSFSIFDAENGYEAYGLIYESKPDYWVCVNE